MKELLLDKAGAIIGVLIVAITGVIWNDLQEVKGYMNEQQVVNERLLNLAEGNRSKINENSTFAALLDKKIKASEKAYYEFKGRYFDILEEEYQKRFKPDRYGLRSEEPRVRKDESN